MTTSRKQTTQPDPPLPDIPEGCRRLAWNGISFAAPENWEVANFRMLRRDGSRIELEDEYTVRLEAEWITDSRRELDVETIMKRYEAASKPLTLKAEEQAGVDDLPEGWYATRFIFKETGDSRKKGVLDVISHGLVTAFYLCPEKTLFAFFLIHFMPDDPEDPVQTVQNLAQGFCNHTTQPFIPWQLFDISFRLPREFRLVKTHFDIGSKMMRFAWKGRQLCLWHFSCADMFLKDGVTPDRWATGFLNGYGGFKGVRFDPDGEGGITWRRRKPFLLGHRSEIARLCFKYDVGWRRIESANKLLVWVFQYRKKSDLQMLGADGPVFLQDNHDA